MTLFSQIDLIKLINYLTYNTNYLTYRKKGIEEYSTNSSQRLQLLNR